MDDSIMNSLWNSYNELKEEIENIEEKGGDYYKTLLEELDKIRRALIDHEKIQKESDIKNKQLKSEEKRERKRNIITIISLIVSVIGMLMTFNFDKTSTITSSMGRGIINSFIPKFIKR